jgi:homoserine dehydrogenase
MAPLGSIRSCFYLRLEVQDTPGVLAQVATVFAERGLSLASVIQKTATRPGAALLILTTHESDEETMRATLAQLEGLSVVLSPPLLLRIGDLPE